MFIYKITNKINQKSYIGYNSADKDTRWRDHKREYIKESQFSKLLYKAMNKYGIDNFLYKRIEDSIHNIELLRNREIFWIAYHQSFGKMGYNMTIGGDGGNNIATYTIEEKKQHGIKISIGHQAMSEESKLRRKKNISKSLIGNMRASNISEESKNKKSELRKNKTYEELYGIEKAIKISQKMSRTRTGSKRSAESCAKQSIQRKGKAQPKLQKTYKLINLITDEEIITNSIKETCTKMNISYWTVEQGKKGIPVKNWLCNCMGRI